MESVVTPKICDPSLVQLGDYVQAHGEKLLVTHIEKQDSINAYDFYCKNESGKPELLTTQEAVTIIL